MIRAKDAITKAIGVTPKYVRATFGYTNADCMKVYGRRLLKHIYWDVESGDASDPPPSVDAINLKLRKETKETIQQGRFGIIVLFHDIKLITASHFLEFISTIKSSAESSPSRTARVVWLAGIDRCSTSIMFWNRIMEQDHRAIKRRVRASQHFRSFWGAWRTIAGY
jgi:hypothetical protein